LFIVALLIFQRELTGFLKPVSSMLQSNFKDIVFFSFFMVPIKTGLQKFSE